MIRPTNRLNVVRKLSPLNLLLCCGVDTGLGHPEAGAVYCSANPERLAKGGGKALHTGDTLGPPRLFGGDNAVAEG